MISIVLGAVLVGLGGKPITAAMGEPGRPKPRPRKEPLPKNAVSYVGFVIGMLIYIVPIVLILWAVSGH